MRPDGAYLGRFIADAPAFALGALAMLAATVAIVRFALSFDPNSSGDSFWLLIDLSMAITLAGWGCLRVASNRRDGTGYLLQCSALAWSFACLGDSGAVRSGAWTPFGATVTVQLVAHLVSRSLLVAAVVVLLPDRAADRFLRRGPLDAAVAGITVVGLVLAFVEPAARELRFTPFGFGNRAWIEIGHQVPRGVLVALLLVHVGAAASLAWTRRGLPPTSFQVIGWVLAVATVPLAVPSIGATVPRGVLDIVALMVFPALPVMSVISIVRAAAAGARTVAELRDAQHRMVDAVEDERRRLRRELHDGLGPALAGVGLGVRAAAARLGDSSPDTARLLVRLGDEVDTCLDEVRRIILDLRPPALDQLGLVGAIEANARRACAGIDGPRLHLALDGLAGAEPLPAAVELAAFRITAEAVTNAVRHSGAKECSVSTFADSEMVVIEVADDGRGLPADLASGVGLVAMRERAAAVGGDLWVGAGPSGGTMVRARLRRARR